MKFSLKTVRNGCRLGLLTELGPNKDRTAATPLCMLYTQGGSAPYLSVDMLRRIENVPAIVHMSINHFADHCSALEAFGKGVAQFSAMKDSVVYCSQHDPATEVPSGYNKKSAVALWSRGGKVKVDQNQFMCIVSACQPDFYQAMSDGDTDRDSSNKRNVKAVDRTLNFLDSVLRQHEESERLRGVGVFGSVVGGHNEQTRLRSARETACKPVDGFVIEGFHTVGPHSEMFELKEVQDLLQKTLSCLPEGKPRVMTSIWRPLAVLEAVEMGIDVFDSAYPYVAMERGCALVFNFQYQQQSPGSHGDATPSQTCEINLKSKRFFEDWGPMLPGCQCYACHNFSRSYVHHLLNTGELLGQLLIMMHNFHHYFQFFATVRQAVEKDKMADLKALLQQQTSGDGSLEEEDASATQNSHTSGANDDAEASV